MTDISLICQTHFIVFLGAFSKVSAHWGYLPCLADSGRDHIINWWVDIRDRGLRYHREEPNRSKNCRGRGR